MYFQINLGSRGIPETWITLNERHSHFIFFQNYLCSKRYILIYFSCLRECCIAVLLQYLTRKPHLIFHQHGEQIMTEFPFLEEPLTC